MNTIFGCWSVWVSCKGPATRWRGETKAMCLAGSAVLPLHLSLSPPGLCLCLLCLFLSLSVSLCVWLSLTLTHTQEQRRFAWSYLAELMVQPSSFSYCHEVHDCRLISKPLYYSCNQVSTQQATILVVVCKISIWYRSFEYFYGPCRLWLVIYANCSHSHHSFIPPSLPPSLSSALRGDSWSTLSEAIMERCPSVVIKREFLTTHPCPSCWEVRCTLSAL